MDGDHPRDGYQPRDGGYLRENRCPKRMIEMVVAFD